MFFPEPDQNIVNELIHVKHVDRAIELSKFGVESGNYPFGSLLVLDGLTVEETWNTTATDHDATKHAELSLVSKVTRKLSAEQLQRSILYTSCEPCPMCTGAIYWAGIPTIVYACPTQVLSEISGDPFVLPCREIYQQGGVTKSVVGPILEEKAAKVLRDFWNKPNAPTGLRSLSPFPNENP